MRKNKFANLLPDEDKNIVLDHNHWQMFVHYLHKLDLHYPIAYHKKSNMCIVRFYRWHQICI